MTQSSFDAARYTTALFPFAYNILGSVDDAKDAVQDVLTAHLAAPKDDIADEKSYLIKCVVNRAINAKTRQQKTLREGEVWLPEPIATDDAADRALHLREVLSYALMVLMERLTPTERAAFILRESFEYSHAEIAAALGITEEHSRQLLRRAKARLFRPAPKRKGEESHGRAVLDRFMHAIRERDTAALEGAMAADIRYYADGGGKVPLAATLCIGATDVAALQTMIYHRWLTAARIEYVTVNHQPALLYYKADALVACQVFDLHPDTGVLQRINAVLDPDKLKHLAASF